MRQFRVALSSIGAFIWSTGTVAAQPLIHFASNNYFAFGDLNGDGTADLVLANSDSRNRIHLNVAPDEEGAVLRR